MSKKIWIAALAGILAVSAGIGSFVVFGSINDLPKAKRTISQEEHDKVKKEVWRKYTDLTSKYYEEIKNNSEYASADDNIKNSIIRSDAAAMADEDTDKYLIELLQKNNLTNKDMTYESIVECANNNDHTKFYDYIRALCKLYNDTDISITTEEMIMIELRLDRFYTYLFDEKTFPPDNYSEEEVSQLQKLIRDTIGLEEPDPNITH